MKCSLLIAYKDNRPPTKIEFASLPQAEEKKTEVEQTDEVAFTVLLQHLVEGKKDTFKDTD